MPYWVWLLRVLFWIATTCSKIHPRVLSGTALGFGEAGEYEPNPNQSMTSNLCNPRVLRHLRTVQEAARKGQGSVEGASPLPGSRGR